ncbi:MAG: hypothetical protein ACI35S_01350 [Anaeroplasma sp.]
MLICKNYFLELEDVSYILNHLDKLNDIEIDSKKANALICIDISYKDKNDQECFKSLSFPISIDLDVLDIEEINLEKLDVYIVEGKGLNIEYCINVEAKSDKNIEIINIDETQKVINKVSDNELSKVKDDISKEYEEKLHNELDERDVSIIKTSSKRSDLEFLSFFDNSVASYYKIKTLECKNEDDLNQISKEYGVPLTELLLGFDKENGRVVFKFKG